MRTFFFFFFFFLLFTFEKDGNLFWVYQNGKFLPGKKHFTPGKKSGKMTFPPQKNMPVAPLVTDFQIQLFLSLWLLWHPYNTSDWLDTDVVIKVSAIMPIFDGWVQFA